MTEEHMDQAGLPYSVSTLDRAGTLRRDPRWLTGRLADPRARVLPMWRDGLLVTGDGGPLRLDAAAAEPLAAPEEWVMLGVDADGVPHFAADLSTMDEAAALAATGAHRVRDVRTLVAGLPAAEASTLARARGLLYWHRRQRYCGACGAPTTAGEGGHLRTCTGCATLLFPRIEPAVITLVEAADGPPRCLLGRPRGSAEGRFSLLAGFVEIGESLEDAAAREVFEETGVRVRRVRYQASQAWPFPAGIMVGFRAAATEGPVRVDADELAEARWFDRGEVAARAFADGPERLFRADSIERHLVETWLAETAP
jgi:NAD+ diphosphatase